MPEDPHPAITSGSERHRPARGLFTSVPSQASVQAWNMESCIGTMHCNVSLKLKGALITGRSARARTHAPSEDTCTQHTSTPTCTGFWLQAPTNTPSTCPTDLQPTCPQVSGSDWPFHRSQPGQDATPGMIWLTQQDVMDLAIFHDNVTI
eukprot:scaffold43669_cov25-Tisochrysis_lutea.AAC.1